MAMMHALPRFWCEQGRYVGQPILLFSIISCSVKLISRSLARSTKGIDLFGGYIMFCFSSASLAVVSGVASFRSRWVNDLVCCGINMHQYQVCVSLDTCFKE